VFGLSKRKEVRNMEDSNQTVLASWLNVVAGIWLIISPFILGYTEATARTNGIWLGIIVGVLALIRAFTPLRSMWVSWLNVVAGIWLIISPFVLGLTDTAARSNDIVLGIIVAVIALWNLAATNSATHSHSGSSSHAHV
jgi:hypothetical protein